MALTLRGVTLAANAADTAYTIDLPPGSAVGDQAALFLAQDYVGLAGPDAWQEIITNSGRGYSTQSASGFQDTSGSYLFFIFFFTLEAADIAAGTIPIPAYSGVLNGTVVGLSAVGNAGLGRWGPGVYTTPGWGIAYDGVLVNWLGQLYDTAAGTPTNPGLSDVITIAANKLVAAIGDGTVSGGSLTPTTWDPGPDADSAELQLYWLSYFEVVPLVIDTPAALALAGGPAVLHPGAKLIIDTPALFSLAGGAPLVAEVNDLPIDTPAAFTLAGGAPVLAAPLGPAVIAIDTPAAFTLAGAAPSVWAAVPPAVLSIDTPAAFTLAGSTPLLTPVNELGPITCELDLLFSVPGLYQGLPASAVTMADAIGFGVDMHASTLIQAPNFLDYDQGDLQLRLMQGIYVDMPTPIVAAGKPTLPRFVANLPTVMTLIEGQLDVPPDHIHSIPDPDPIWNGSTSGWYIQPPLGGVGDCRWTVNDLPDPAPYSGQYYWLGDPSSQDGTSGIEGGARQWAPNAGTPGAPSWRSVFPYKPSVREHVNYGAGGNILTKTRGVRYNLQYIEHMWLDFGGLIGAPFTWVIVGIIMDFPSAAYQHNILDVGRNPNAGGVPNLSASQVNVDRSVAENIQGGARPALWVGQSATTMIADEGATAAINTTFNAATRPKMFFGVWDGANSFGGSYSTAGKQLVKGSLPDTGTRYVLMGRRSNILSRNYDAHLVVFEIRFWRSALVEEQLDDQYGQLGSTWDFGAYG